MPLLEIPRKIFYRSDKLSRRYFHYRNPMRYGYSLWYYAKGDASNLSTVEEFRDRFTMRVRAETLTKYEGAREVMQHEVISYTGATKLVHIPL